MSITFRGSETPGAGSTIAIKASEISITDLADYFAATNVEAALAELAVEVDANTAQVATNVADIATNLAATVANAAGLAAHIADVANPHSVTKTQVGLGNVTDDAQLKIASNLADVADAATALANLGGLSEDEVLAYIIGLT